MPDAKTENAPTENLQTVANHRTKWENKPWWLNRNNSPEDSQACRNILVNMATTNSVTMTREHKAAAQQMLQAMNAPPGDTKAAREPPKDPEVKAPEVKPVDETPAKEPETTQDPNTNTIAGVETEEVSQAEHQAT